MPEKKNISKIENQEAPKSFTDHFLEINEICQGNALLRTVLLDNLYRNLPEEPKRDIKKILNDYHFKPSQKAGWTCEHEDCGSPSCYSHEISEGAFLSKLSNNESRVYMLARDIKESPILYIEKSIHQRDASNFPGYCILHDSEIFSDIENGQPSLNDHFINKQCLRTTRREIFDLRRKIRSARQFLEQITPEILQFEDIKELKESMEEKIALLESRLNRAATTYKKIFSGILSRNYEISYKEISIQRAGYYFSTMLDLTINEKDHEPCMLFLYKLDFGEKPKVVICSINNETSKHESASIEKNHKKILTEIMYTNKERLIFSQGFIDSLGETTK